MEQNPFRGRRHFHTVEVSSLIIVSPQDTEIRRNWRFWHASITLCVAYKLLLVNRRRVITKILLEATRAQYINKTWAARIQLDKKETVIVRGREVKPIAWSALDLLSEAIRIDGHIPHVKKPLPPGILYACDDQVLQNPLKVAQLADAWAESRKAVTGRAYQRNSPVMAGIVISLPKEMIEDWPGFRDASVKWMKEKYGERLKLVIEHLDEENPHLHAFLVASHGFKNGQPFSETFGAVHEGYAESRATRRGSIEKSGTSKGAKTGKAFIDAMKEYQDKFQRDVARHFNLARLGPQMKKLSHAEAIRQRDIRKAEADRIEAEKLKEKAFEEVRAAMEARRLANEEIARKKAEAEQDAAAISRKMIDDAQEKAKVESQRILKIASLAAEEKEWTMQALIKGDEQIAVRVFKENIMLKEDLRLTQRALEVAKQEVEIWKNKFHSAYSWLKDAVKKLEFFGDFSFSRIFTKQAVEQLKENERTREGEGDQGEVRKRLSSLPKPSPKGYKAD